MGLPIEWKSITDEGARKGERKAVENQIVNH